MDNPPPFFLPPVLPSFLLLNYNGTTEKWPA